MTNTEAIDQLAQDIREVDGEHTLSAADLAEALVAKGWTQQVTETKPAGPKPLLSYVYGDLVIVLGPDLKERPGRVGEVNKGTNLVNVDTERGPVTINRADRIRLQES